MKRVADEHVAQPSNRYRCRYISRDKRAFLGRGSISFFGIRNAEYRGIRELCKLTETTVIIDEVTKGN
jgi:hypothetical protein